MFHVSRRLIAAALTAMLLLSLVPALAGAQTAPTARDVDEACGVATEAEFSDKPSGDTGDAIDCIAYYGITQGTTPTTYSPGQVVNRAQMATFLVRKLSVAGIDLPAPAEDQFDDDDGFAPHEENINKLSAAGIAAGFPDDTFRPRLQVTRAQMATFVVREIEHAIGEKLPDSETDHFDDDDGLTAHEGNINKLADIGVVQGTGPKTFSPSAGVNRAQMALFLARNLDYLTEEADIPLRRFGVVNPTAGPDLVSVSVATPSAQAAQAGDNRTVKFTFDDVVNASANVLPPENYRLYSFAADQILPAEGSTVQRDPSDTSSVLVQFPASGVDQATTAAVNRGAAQDASRPPQPRGQPPAPGGWRAGCAPRSRPTSSPSRGPARRSASSSTRWPSSSTTPQYHLVLDDGTVKDSTAVGNATGTEGASAHTPTFELAAGEADRVVRGHVGAGAVSDQTQEGANPIEGPLGETNPQQSADVAADGETSRPDLVGITLDESNNRVRYRFDEAVELVEAPFPPGTPAGVFNVYYLNRQEASSSDAQVVEGDARTVQVTFAAGEVSSLVVGASVDAGAVSSAVSSTSTNQVDEEVVERSFAAGETAAPDLLSVGRLQGPASSRPRASSARSSTRSTSPCRSCSSRPPRLLGTA